MGCLGLLDGMLGRDVTLLHGTLLAMRNHSVACHAWTVLDCCMLDDVDLHFLLACLLAPADKDSL